MQIESSDCPVTPPEPLAVSSALRPDRGVESVSTADVISCAESLTAVDGGTRVLSGANPSRAVMVPAAGGRLAAATDRAMLVFA
jgi:hypothetical protein